jgi:ABC-type dipeptide/oligopeptide/nickel transport system permease component
MILISVPSFVLITVLIYVFAYIDPLNPLLPASWPLPTDPDHWKVLGYIIPVIALSLGSIAGYCRFVRAELCEVMSSEYLLLARTKGLTKRQATTRHALRNAMVPIFPSIVGEFVAVLSGSLIIEKIFSIPGVGNLYLASINNQDYDFFMLLSSFYLLVGLAAGLVIDLSYGIIDPRIRMGAK